jgi:hypothetical protein
MGKYKKKCHKNTNTQIFTKISLENIAVIIGTVIKRLVK